MLSTKRAVDRHACATAESARVLVARSSNDLHANRTFRKQAFNGVDMDERILALDVEELEHVGGGWGELDPNG
jgi:proline racemase